jgi:hypothetical protein
MPKTRLTSKVPANLSNAKGLAGRGYRPLPGERSMTKAQLKFQSRTQRAMNKNVTPPGKFSRNMSDGKVRQYDRFRPSKQEGRIAGSRKVTEIDPKTGKKRVWMENYDHEGQVIIVHPKFPQDPGHLMINPNIGKVIDRWP